MLRTKNAQIGPICEISFTNTLQNFYEFPSKSWKPKASDDFTKVGAGQSKNLAYILLKIRADGAALAHKNLKKERDK